MKTIRVVAAVICDRMEQPSQIFAAARGYGEYKGLWEFPGGKVEPGETSRQALIREIREELSVSIAVGDRITTVEYDYPTFHLSMECFRCEIESGEIRLNEAADGKWLTVGDLNSLCWLPADRALIEILSPVLKPDALSDRINPEIKEEERLWEKP